MSAQESSWNWIVKNSLVTGCVDVTKFASKQVASTLGAVATVLAPKPPPTPSIVYMDPLPLWNLAGTSNIFIRVAGLSCASAVTLGAYGAHANFEKDENDKLRLIFETANKYHFIHTLALLGTPLCHYPMLTGSMLTIGMLMFCGTCYYRALTGNDNLRRITPVGGTMLILAWLTMVI